LANDSPPWAFSTRAIVNLYHPDPSVRHAILSEVRRSSITLDNPELGSITFRDRLPLKFLKECLYDGVRPQDLLDALPAGTHARTPLRRSGPLSTSVNVCAVFVHDDADQ